MRHELPLALPGQRIGLLGGSFDPPHRGHLHISLAALKRFRLDRVWWLVSPGNPLKTRGPAALEARLAASRALVDHPRILVTDIEARIGTRYTAETVSRLRALYPGVHFVWLMGADNLAGFHRWQNWRSIMQEVPVGVLARPGERISARVSRAARIYRYAKIPAAMGPRLAVMAPPAWCFVNLPMVDASSTAIRNSGAWSAQG
ncbi:nicotinic acid mononucleotide adenylyltransferase [Maritimibacter sp. 55A14]|uniref:nicotinate-nucleotide adenylyltransferase n=1 Tax=Maritimibacter sp. 55A14 TaxID=2174844 RepID=UPI000D617F59|nr:nicotinate-nucleotide adenylyltransferase [Maritimibacter sp. 55A14]PWE29298.1 nicotinic acid mononucleotide adenylyltransferase [Maritimibacter sp. 55A14]